MKPICFFNTTVELMCHPGHPNYIEENNLVKQKILENTIKVQYINYNEL